MPAVTTVNAMLDRLFDLLLRPLRPLPVLMSLAVVSLLTAIAILLVVRATSNQRALEAVKRQMYADLLEMRLFNDDLRGMWRAQWSMLRHNGRYLRLSLVPALWTLVPLALVLTQLQFHFGYAEVGVGEPVLVTAVVKSRGDLPGVALEPPRGVRVDTAAIRFPALQQVVWRVVADSPGEFVLGVRAGGATYEKTLCISGGLARRSPVRPAPRLIDQLRYPSETPLPDSAALASIGVAYADRPIDVIGWQVPWIAAYIALSFAFALALKKPLRVTL
jgi:uncharacterized membrane protein (DUF106 family)